MKIKLLTICFFLLTSQVFAWSDYEYKTIFEGCMGVASNGKLSYKQQKIYCTCSSDSISAIWTVQEVQKMVLSNTFSKQKEFNVILKRCSKKIGF